MFHCEECGKRIKEPNEYWDFLCEDCEEYCERCGDYCYGESCDGMCEDCYEDYCEEFGDELDYDWNF